MRLPHRRSSYSSGYSPRGRLSWPTWDWPLAGRKNWCCRVCCQACQAERQASRVVIKLDFFLQSKRMPDWATCFVSCQASKHWCHYWFLLLTRQGFVPMPFGHFRECRWKRKCPSGRECNRICFALHDASMCSPAQIVKDALRGAYHSRLHNMFTDSEVIVQISN